MQSLEVQGSIKGVLALRLVSKAWHDAFKHYPAAVACIHPSDDLQTICSIMPCMASLQLYDKSPPYADKSRHDPPDLHPLLGCIQLTRIDFNDTYMSSACIDLACLPASLVEIKMTNFRATRTCFEHLQCSRLTKLDCRNGDSPATEIWTLLQKLPHLKVSV